LVAVDVDLVEGVGLDEVYSDLFCVGLQSSILLAEVRQEEEAAFKRVEARFRESIIFYLTNWVFHKIVQHFTQFHSRCVFCRLIRFHKAR
jgi:hypothetical protein